MKEQDHVVFGSLLHDIGKFFERSKLSCQDQRRQYCTNYQLTESALKNLVQTADFFARTEREQDVAKNTRLESLLSKISLNHHRPKARYFLPLSALALKAEAIYPQQDNGELLDSDYEKLAKAFFDDLKSLPEYAQQTPGALRAIVRTLLALMEKYLSQVPAGADVSLFDHLRITAAIGEGLYHYHADDLARADFKDQQIAKWRLVCGDFSGIQNFIYKITSKGAAKGLRGRSFFIQLLCDAAAEQLIRKLGLYATARIYSSGGKFYLLIAENKLKDLKQEVESINHALLRQFRGEMCLSIGIADINADDFKAGNMGKRWQEVNEDLLKNRQQAFIAQLVKDESFFKPKALHSKGACQVCDRDDFQAGIQIDNDRRICRQCKDFETIGQKLVDTQYLFWVWGADRAIVKHSQLPNLHRFNLYGTDCTLYFLEKSPEFSEKTPLYDCHLENLNVIEPPNGNPQGYSTSFRFVGKWQRDKASGGYDFEHFAEHGEGIERMGVLRMDVDNLGEIFIRGLNFKQSDQGIVKMGSLSRVATLSRQLHLFFAGFLANLTTDYPLTQIIYAGGDDVFIIGSWHELPELANKIRTEFKRYCADNDSFTLSGGIALATGKYPISKVAEAAGEAESQAKQLKRGSKEKDALSFFDTVIGWESFDNAVQMKDKICAVTDKTNSHALIDRLRQVVIATDKIKKMPNFALELPYWKQLLYWNQWRWRLIYNLKRMAQRNSAIEPDLQQLLRQLLEEPQNNHQSALDWLAMPVRWAEFLKRK